MAGRVDATSYRQGEVMKTTKERDTEAAFITEALEAEADAIRRVCERAGTIERTN
jgi:hypothetical protein